METRVRDDAAGVTVTQTGGSTDVTEGGATDVYTVQLTSQPLGDVTIALNPGAQASVSRASLTFTAGNWNAAQMVTVAAVDDSAAEGTHTGNITHTSGSTDPIYNGMAIASVTVHITDNDTSGVVVTQSGGNTSVSESGTTDTYTVVLNSQPLAAITVNLSGDAQASVSPSSLVFDVSSWNVAQTVTVSAVDDFVAEGSHTGTIGQSVSGADPNYNGYAVPPSPCTSPTTTPPA